MQVKVSDTGKLSHQAQPGVSVTMTSALGETTGWITGSIRIPFVLASFYEKLEMNLFLSQNPCSKEWPKKYRWKFQDREFFVT